MTNFYKQKTMPIFGPMGFCHMASVIQHLICSYLRPMRDEKLHLVI